MVLSTPNFGIQSYVDSYNSIAEKNSLNQELYTRQDFSIMGIVRRIVGKAEISGWASLVITVVFFGGLQLIILGILGIYIGKIFKQIKERPNYIIRSKNK